MCGIYFSQSLNRHCEPDEATLAALVARGPDVIQTRTVTVPQNIGGNVFSNNLLFCSSVLALRGNEVQGQPIVDDETGSVLCWNGEAWTIDQDLVQENDSLQVFRLLLSATKSSSVATLVPALEKIAGPYAFVFYDALHSLVYFGRDRLGRRSLLLDETLEKTLMVSSTATSTHAKECQTTGVYALNLGDSTLSLHPWLSIPPKINPQLPLQAIDTMPTATAVTAFSNHFSQALRPRILNIPIHDQLHQHSDCARLAILFSGGLDCTLMARMCHDLLPTNSCVDLINVAFENPRSMAAKVNSNLSPYEICPDRITGRASFSELIEICPSRSWRFVAVNVPHTELLEHKNTILQLMRPHDTEMDLSIAMALYFAARGKGMVTRSDDMSEAAKSDTTTARVLLSGLGADELFAGYSRHAAAFARASYQGLIDELDLDFSRIGQRNLGRDDRVMCHWGKEVRYPYLDEQFVKFALGLPVWEKCGFRPEKKIPKHYEQHLKAERAEDLDPAKMLLRLATWESGMKTVANERKRAIQFGARTAKMEIGAGRKKGTDKLVAA